jgi:hypothetical protein
MIRIKYLGAGIFREANGERRSEDLFFKEIFLVQKEDDGGVAEPLVVADRVEQLQALLHSVLKKQNSFCLIFSNK